MRVAVLEHDQELQDAPKHYLRSSYANQLVGAKFAAWIVPRRLLQVIVKRTFTQLLAWLRPIKINGVPSLLPPGPSENLDLYYPARYQAGSLREHEGMARACELLR